MLQVNSLSVYYGTRKILQDIYFNLEPGDILAVIGPNGAGKSTLIRALSGVIPVSSGQIRYKDQDIIQLNIEERSRLIAVVPQAGHVPPAFTVWETVLLGRTPYLNWLGQASESDHQKAQQAMEKTSTLELSHRIVGELSGGEQQRVLLARALAQDAPILLMDEPTTHLDLKYQISLLDQVQTLVKGELISALIAMHDLNLVSRFADQVALLVDGKIKAVGTPKEVLQSSLLSEAYQIPLEVLQTNVTRAPLVLPVNRNGERNTYAG